MAKQLICLNGWVRNACCGGNREDYLHGVMIKDGVSIMAKFNYPFEVYVEKKKLVITKNGESKTFFIGEFSQTEAEIKDIIANCITAKYGTNLIQKQIEFTVTVPEDTFVLPIASGEVFAGSDFVTVFMPNLVNQGDGTLLDPPDFAFEYQVINETVIFNEELPFEAGQDPYHLTIIYWVYI